MRVSTPVQPQNQVEGGRALLRFRLFGFPVHVDASFVIMIGIIGYLSGFRWSELPLWLLVAAVSVLVHEFGHAFLARTTGASPAVALVAFGGVTTFVPPRQLSRIRSLSISAAGPVVGIAFGVLLLGLVRVLGPLDEDSWLALAYRMALFTSIGWGVLNLLPILPLDGGQVMRELLPGEPPVRARRAAVVSIGVAVAVGAFAWYIGYYSGVLIAGFFILVNFMEARRPAAGGGRLTPEQAIVEQLWNSKPEEARALLAAMPPGTEVDLAVHGAVLAVTSDREQGLALLLQEVQRRPEDGNAMALLVLAHTLLHEWDAVVQLANGPYAAVIPSAVLTRARQEALSIGDPEAAKRIPVPE
jgi:Zn-dependent protease